MRLGVIGEAAALGVIGEADANGESPREEVVLADGETRDLDNGASVGFGTLLSSNTGKLRAAPQTDGEEGTGADGEEGTGADGEEDTGAEGSFSSASSDSAATSIGAGAAVSMGALWSLGAPFTDFKVSMSSPLRLAPENRLRNC